MIHLQREPLVLGAHKNNEPAYALVARLAKRNGYESGRLFLMDRGLNEHDVEQGKHVDRIAILAGVDAKSLRNSTLVASHGTATVQGEIIPRGHWQLHRNRYCRRCHEEDSHTNNNLNSFGVIRRTWWDFVHIHRCPIHQATLEPIKQRIPRTKYANHRAVQVSCGWESYFIGRLGFADRRHSDLLDRLSLAAASRLVALCGAAHVYGRHSPHNMKGLFQQGGIMAAGFVIAEKEKSFLTFLDRLWEKTEQSQRGWFTRSIYGFLGQRLGGSKQNDFDYVRTIMISHVRSNMHKYLRKSGRLPEPFYYDLITKIKVKQDLVAIHPSAQSGVADGASNFVVSDEMVANGVHCMRGILGKGRVNFGGMEDKVFVRSVLEAAVGITNP